MCIEDPRGHPAYITALLIWEAAADAINFVQLNRQPVNGSAEWKGWRGKDTSRQDRALTTAHEIGRKSTLLYCPFLS